jgi:porin
VSSACGWTFRFLCLFFNLRTISLAQQSEPPLDASGLPAEKEPSSRFPVRYEAQRMFGWIDRHGATPSFTFINDWSRNFRGGVEAGSLNRYLLKTSVAIDTKKAMGWNGGTAFASLQHHLGKQGGDEVGDAQGFSNIDAPAGTHLYELWYQQVILNAKLRVKAGRVDANSEFAVVENGADFMNSSMGYSPTILALPTYPEPRPSVNVFYRPTEQNSLAGGLYDTAGNGAMLLGEAGRRWVVSSRELPGRTGLGFWRLTGKVPCFDGDMDSGANGFYLVGEQTVWRSEQSEPKRAQAVSMFLQYGRASGDVSRFSQHVGGGLVWQSPFHQRPQDGIGVGTTWVRFTEVPEAGFERENELALEAYYKLRIIRAVTLMPDVQFIHHPGGLRCQRDTLVLTPRIVLSF